MLYSIVRHSLVEFAACNPDSPFCPEHTAYISVGVLMNFPVALAAESDKVVLGILALMAPKSLVMNFECGERAAGLAAPPVAL